MRRKQSAVFAGFGFLPDDWEALAWALREHGQR
jgi:hypothetical protein